MYHTTVIVFESFQNMLINKTQTSCNKHRCIAKYFDSIGRAKEQSCLFMNIRPINLQYRYNKPLSWIRDDWEFPISMTIPPMLTCMNRTVLAAQTEILCVGGLAYLIATSVMFRSALHTEQGSTIQQNMPA